MDEHTCYSICRYFLFLSF
jgi:hypothetical protein